MTEEPKIEKGIPIAAAQRSIGKPKQVLRRTVERMEVGDSFFIPAEKEALQQCQRLLINKGWLCRPKKYATRQVPGGVRIWRVE